MARKARPAAPPPAPMPVPAVEPMRRPRSRTWTYVFGGVYAAMLVLGFGIGLQAGTPKPTPAKKAVAVAEKKDKPGAKGKVNELPDETALLVKPKQPAAKEDPKKPPMPEATEGPKPMPETTPEKPEPKPEPKMEKPEPKPEPKKTEPKPPAKTEPKKSPNPTGQAVAFSKVLAVFKDKCINCHGGAERKGDLDMRDAKVTIKGGESGPGVVPGDPENSLIWQRIEDKDKPMPPKNKPQLTEAEKKLIKGWIAGGAK